MRLAREVITLFHGHVAAQAAEAEFVQVFQKREMPSDMPSVTIALGATVAEFLVANNLAASKGEARRLVQQGGVSVDGTKIADASAPAVAGVWRVGPRRFVRAG
jgi:tyrosyl-tRNA synthetase